MNIARLLAGPASVGLTICWMLSTAAIAQEVLRPPTGEDGSLVWQFHPGQVLSMEMVQDIEMTFSAAIRNIESSSRITTDTTVHVHSVDEQGVAEATSLIERISLTTQAPGLNLEFDSDANTRPTGPSAEIAQMMRPLIGAGIDQKMTPDGKIEDVVIPDKALQGFENATPLLGSLFTRDSLEQMITQSSIEFPEPRPETGYTWETDRKLKMGPAPVSRKTTWTYLGVTDLAGKPVHRIQGQIEIDFPEGVEGTTVTVSDDKAVVDIWFDGVAGQLVRSRLNHQTRMSFETGTQTMEQSIRQSMNLEVESARQPTEPSDKK